MNFAWTEEGLEHFKALLGRKLTARQIAIEMGISRNAVIGKAHRSGIQLGKPGGPHGPREPRQSRNGGAALAAIKARQQQERAIRAKIGDNRIKAAALARATALGELRACEAVNLPADPVNTPTVALLDLKESHCRWPIDAPDGTATSRRFCGCERAHDQTPYCARHHAIAYTERPGRQRENEDGQKARIQE